MANLGNDKKFPAKTVPLLWSPSTVRLLADVCSHLLSKQDISFATLAICSSKKISPLLLQVSPDQRRYLFCHCGHLLFKKDIAFATEGIWSLKKLSTLPVWMSFLQRKISSASKDVSSSKRISPLPLQISPLQRRHLFYYDRCLWPSPL
jgi:hypothetical protein